MKLSICTMFYDANKELFANWIKRTKDAVKIEYELVVTDNTTAQDLPETDGVKIVRAGGNILPFEGRRLAVEASTGDYCFLVDCDDLILPILEFPYDEDMHYLDSVHDGPYVWHVFFTLKVDNCKRTDN